MQSYELTELFYHPSTVISIPYLFLSAGVSRAGLSEFEMREMKEGSTLPKYDENSKFFRFLLPVLFVPAKFISAEGPKKKPLSYKIT